MKTNSTQNKNNELNNKTVYMMKSNGFIKQTVSMIGDKSIETQSSRTKYKDIYERQHKQAIQTETSKQIEIKTYNFKKRFFILILNSSSRTLCISSKLTMHK